MKLDAADQALLKKLYRNVSDTPLEPGHAFYEPVYGEDGPVEHMLKHVQWAELESVQYFSGFRGSGKTTELKRLADKLEAAGYFVVYADAEKYINLAGPIDITDLLPVLAGAFSDALEARFGQSVLQESYWTRFLNYLERTEVNLQEFGLKAGGAAAPAGLALDLKIALRGTPSFRRQVQQKLAVHIGNLKAAVDRFFEEGIQLIRQKLGEPDKKVVFFLDSLEQIRGSLFDETEVLASVATLLNNQGANLRIPYVHLIYTVPPWVKFLHPNLPVKFQIIPSVCQWENDAARTPVPEGNASLGRLLARRFDVPGSAERVFGPATPGVNQLVKLCGGHFRDLLRLVSEILVRANQLPISDQVLSDAIASVRSQFLPLATDDALWLEEIARTRQASHASREEGAKLARFLDSHLVLFFRRGEEWYDIHPLIREQVALVAAQGRDSKRPTAA